MTKTTSGLLGALVASLCFGSNYVPVKKYPTYDGFVFQWFQCSGILFIGLIEGSITNDWTNFGDRTVGGLYVSYWGILGGCLWACANMLATPVVKYLGLGLGFVLWNCCNIIVAWCVATFHIFGIKHETSDNNTLNSIGIICIILSLALMLPIQPNMHPTNANPNYVIVDATIAPHNITNNNNNASKQSQYENQKSMQHSAPMQICQPNPANGNQPFNYNYLSNAYRTKEEQTNFEATNAKGKPPILRLNDTIDSEQTSPKNTGDSRPNKRESKQSSSTNAVIRKAILQSAKLNTPLLRSRSRTERDSSILAAHASATIDEDVEIKPIRDDTMADLVMAFADEPSVSYVTVSKRKAVPTSGLKRGRTKSVEYLPPGKTGGAAIGPPDKAVIIVTKQDEIVSQVLNVTPDVYDDEDQDDFVFQSDVNPIINSSRHYHYRREKHSHHRHTEKKTESTSESSSDEEEDVEDHSDSHSDSHDDDGEDVTVAATEEDEKKDMKIDTNTEDFTPLSVHVHPLPPVVSPPVADRTYRGNIQESHSSKAYNLSHSKRHTAHVVTRRSKIKGNLSGNLSGTNPTQKRKRRRAKKDKAEQTQGDGAQQRPTSFALESNATFTNPCSNYLDFSMVARQIVLEKWERQQEMRRQLEVRLQKEHLTMLNNRHIDAEPPSVATDALLCICANYKFIGFFVCIIMGFCVGNSLTPFLVWKQHYKNWKNGDDPNPMAFMFSQIIGIYFFSTVVFLLKGMYSRLIKDKLKRPVMRPAIVSGLIWAVGFAGQLYAVTNLPYTVGYPICAIGPVLVSTLWSLLFFREIKGRHNLTVLCSSMLFMVIGIVLLIESL